MGGASDELRVQLSGPTWCQPGQKKQIENEATEKPFLCKGHLRMAVTKNTLEVRMTKGLTVIRRDIGEGHIVFTRSDGEVFHLMWHETVTAMRTSQLDAGSG